MELKLNPPSGYADSYLDVEFTAEFDRSDKIKLRLFNETSKEQLDILGVTTGYILNGNEVICKNCSEIKGHLNIFNNDKMNRKFKAHSSVTIRFELECETKGEKSQITEYVTFYNEAVSLDAGIIPFELKVHNPLVDVENNVDLKIDIISGLARRFEICLRSVDEVVSCPIEISARIGKTTVHIPAEMIYHDLDLKKNSRRKYQLYYVKYQGTTYSRLANRKYIPLANADITFKLGSGLTSQPQKCNSPTGICLDDRFMISDRYLVPCPKEYSGLTPKTTFGPTKLMDLTMLLYESQDMRSVEDEIQQFAMDDSQEKIKDTRKKLRISQMSEKPQRPKISAYQFQMLKTHSGSYDKVSYQHSTNVKQPSVDAAVNTFSRDQNQDDPGCMSCARKRRLKNAQSS